VQLAGWMALFAGAKETAAQAKEKAAQAAKETAVHTQEAAARLAKDGVAKATKLATEAEDEVRKRALLMLEAAVGRAMPKVTSSLQAQLVDPDMPTPVAGGARAIADNLSSEIKEVILASLQDTVLRKADDERILAERPTFSAGPLVWIRAFILYTLFAHDKSSWAKYRDPFYWLFMLVGSVPVLGIRCAWWCLVFALQDHFDDYSLCNFVISFKATLFYSAGLQAAVLGSALYTACLEHDNCESAAPGSAPPLYELELLATLLQCAVCWAAMGCLPWATAKGGFLFADDRLAGEAAIHSKGGRLWPLMVWDTVVLIGCLGVGAYVWWGADAPDYLVRARLWHIKMLYALSALPFAILKLPLMYTLVLHLRPTGYNRAGALVRVASAKERRQALDRRLQRWNVKVQPLQGARDEVQVVRTET